MFRFAKCLGLVLALTGALCQQQEEEEESSRPKDLMCPAPSGRPGPCYFKPGVNCIDDSWCRGRNMLCCSEGCGKVCKRGVSKRDFTCPPSSGRPGICVFDPEVNCIGNDKCGDGMFCCKEGCGRVCKPAISKKDLTCPPPSGRPGICRYDPSINCLRHIQCQEGEFCCKEGCGKVCKPAILKTDLACPPPSGRPGICVFDPSINCLGALGHNTCGDGKLCCKEGCGRVCKPGVLKTVLR